MITISISVIDSSVARIKYDGRKQFKFLILT
jgi:hypothetical protein